MCLILFAWQAHPRYSLVVAANRDEFHQRPTAAAGFWEKSPELLAGRDLQAGGTWLGVTKSGRFAAITNFREPQVGELPREHSRGHLVTDFLLDDSQPLLHAEQLAERGSDYSGFNLLLGSGNSLAYVSNRSQQPATVSVGSHGLSNHLLDTDWPKVHAGRAQLESLMEDEHLEPEALLELLGDRSVAPGKIPEGTEDKLVPERVVRQKFIVSPDYGTRSSTVFLMGRDGNVEFVERQFDSAGNANGTRRFEFARS
jgi:uncharacterized protein with NRDE domain